MIWSTKTKEKRKIQKENRLRQWHEWFAWYPVHVDVYDIAWLERVFRRWDTCDGWLYKCLTRRHYDNC